MRCEQFTWFSARSSCYKTRSTLILFSAQQTLSDPDTRAAYDALIGFSDTAVNPFKDTGFEYDQVAHLHAWQLLKVGPDRACCGLFH